MKFKEKNVVCFGGGTGLPTLLSGLKRDPWLNVSAIVNMFDTGGSSGYLKDKFGILPPGDVLKCLLALSKNEEYAREMLLTRIEDGENTKHTGGNIMLLGLENVYEDCITAIDNFGKLLQIRGRVIPVTTKRSELQAQYTNGDIRSGETAIDQHMQEGATIDHLYLLPRVTANQAAIEAIKTADLICIGPGSFYTSVMPNFLPSGIKQAIKRSPAKIVLIANLFTEGKGMANQDVASLASTVQNAVGRSMEFIVVNSVPVKKAETHQRYEAEHKQPLEVGWPVTYSRIIEADLWTDQTYARHDSARLGALISWLSREPR